MSMTHPGTDGLAVRTIAKIRGSGRPDTAEHSEPTTFSSIYTKNFDDENLQVRSGIKWTEYQYTCRMLQRYKHYSLGIATLTVK